LDYVDLVPVEVQAEVYLTAGHVYYIICGEHDQSRLMLQKALQQFSDLKNIREMGWSHSGLLGTSEMFPEQREFALEHFEKSIRYLSEVDDQVGIAQAYNNMGIHEQMSSNFDSARAAHQQALEIARRSGDPLRERIELNNLGGIDHVTGNVLSARRFYRESLRVVLDAGLDLVCSAADLCIDIAWTEFDLGRPKRGVILLGAGDALYKAGAFRPQTPQLKYINNLYEFSRTQLTEDEYQQAWTEGRAMTPEEAVAFALEEPDRVA
jgi:tetratricopeptide (TPR) repeat protein